MTVRVECSTIPREALQKVVRANRVQSRGSGKGFLAVSETKKATDKALRGTLSYPNCHLVALWFATLGLTWQKGGDQSKKDTLQTALVLVEDLHLRGWDVDFTNHVAYKVSRATTYRAPVMFTVYCCMI